MVYTKKENEMKKLLVLAAVAAMGAMSAKAGCILDNAFIVHAKGDENPGDGVIQSGYYQFFIIQNAGADIDAVADYVKGKTVAQIESEAKVTYPNLDDGFSYYNGGGEEQYMISSTGASKTESIDIDPYQAYLVAFYGAPTETPTEFYVIENTEFVAGYNALYYDDSNGLPSTSGWQNYSAPTPGPVPEPTSGLLLLLGVAGLALKRKRA